MIIIAAAIILSISNSGIIDKANRAKTDSDTANLKEYVNVLEAEWEMMTKKEQKDTEKSRIEYINDKLEKKYPQAALSVEGEVYTNLTENARIAIVSGIKIGDVVTGYTLDTSKSSYTTNGNENTAPNGTSSEGTPTSQTISQIAFTTWKFAGISENGKIMLIPDMVTGSEQIKLSGKGGYLNGPSMLNEMCRELYSTNKGIARSINREDIFKILKYNGPVGEYEDKSGNSIPIFEEKTVNEIADEIEYNMNDFKKATPDGLDVGKYIVNHVEVSIKSEYILANDVCKNLIFQAPRYWCASGLNKPNFTIGKIDLYVCNVNHFWISRHAMANTNGWSSTGGADYHRPIVEINENVSVSYSNGELTIN